MQKAPVAQPLRTVLDTNIVIDLLHFSDARTRMLGIAIREGRLQCFSDEKCLAELERVTCYPEFGLGTLARQALMQDYRKFVIDCPENGEESHSLPRCRDADDQKFLALAARCHANLLITRDKMLLRLARHRSLPPPFAIVTAEAAEGFLLQLFQPAAEDPAQRV